MISPRLAVAGALVAAVTVLTGVLGPAGTATAQDDPSPSPQPEAAASPTVPGPTAAPFDPQPDTSTVEAGKTVSVMVLKNDGGDPTATKVESTTDPRATVSGDQKSIGFTARSTDRGPVSFGYTATDGQTQASTTVTVNVTAPPAPPAIRRVSISMPRTVVALHVYSISGAVNLAAPGPVDVAVQRYYSGGWHRWKDDRADAAGRYAVAFSTNRTTKVVFRSVATWADHKQATSDRLTRTVVGRAEAAVSGPLGGSDVPYSYRAGCPVGPSGLRRVTINRFTYSGAVARGSLVVRASAVPAVTNVFRAAFASRFPVHSMKPTDAFYAGGDRTPTQSDVAAMRADNTSAFNCRPVTGNPYRISQHSYGNAIDINTVRNPYVVGSRVYPSFARTYLNRSDVRKGMITRGGVVASRFRSLGWPWGARWAHPDYQHFSSNGG